MTDSQIFSRPARPYSVIKNIFYMIVTVFLLSTLASRRPSYRDFLIIDMIKAPKGSYIVILTFTLTVRML